MLKSKLLYFITPLYFILVIIILTTQQCNFKNSHQSSKNSDFSINQEFMSARSNTSDDINSYSNNISPIYVPMKDKSPGVSLSENKNAEEIENRNITKIKNNKNIDAKPVLKKENKKERKKENLQSKESKGKNQLVALLLVLFLGVYGVHRFYLGYTLIGIIQILTLGGFFIWTIVDLVRIINGTLKPKKGEYEKKL